MRTITGLRISAAAAGAICALAVLPVGANAAFDTAHDAQCENGVTIAGIGASFQRQAHLAWGARIMAPDAADPEDNGFGVASTVNGGCASFRVGGQQQVTFEPQGSGEGRAAMGATGVRNSNYQFGAADEPPTEAQLKIANEGPTTATTDDAVLLTVPVAQSSVAPVIKLPAGCTVPADGRQMTREILEGAFAGKAGYTLWGQVLPGIVGTDCADKPVQRVVRFDSSGTTFALKNYLRDVNASDFPTSLGNTSWPNDTAGTPTATVRPTSKGAGALLDTLNNLAGGGIGYADLAAARNRGFDSNVLPGTITPPGGGAPVVNPDAGKPDPADTTFWVRVQGRDQQFRSPALNDTKGTTNTGSNCREAKYTDAATGKIPAVTQSWYGVNANASTAAYPLCALTYELVWQDMAKANVNLGATMPAYTQDQARSVKDYLGYVVNAGGGQAALAPNGYQGLPSIDSTSGAAVPSSILDVAEVAQRSITWNGAPIVAPPTGGGDTGGDGGNTGGDGGNTGGDGGNTGGGSTTTPVVTTPSVATPLPVAPVVPATPATPAAKVTVTKAVGAKGRRIVLTVSPSAAGKLAVSATTLSGKKTVTIGKGTLTVKKGGKLVLTITPSSAGKRALKPGRTVKVTFKVTFTAKTGKKSTVTKTVKVKIKR
jgi:hypothetical protein